ncbi:trypsin-like serine peptidase [Rhodomicrobium lacus]|uniref:trypsin-like serine peptidase n=1 Tax=Rhodomicrobium lacus TaxID=2498452 RepID=UPI000F8CB56E|nr:trypsin-like serine protease [Rhodomicrobium lacus]
MALVHLCAFIFLLNCVYVSSAFSEPVDTHSLESSSSQPIDNYEQINNMGPRDPFRRAASSVGIIAFDLVNGSYISCSGLLISPTLVLTARHCLYRSIPGTGELERYYARNVTFTLDYTKPARGLDVELETEPAEIGEGELDYMLLKTKTPVSLENRWVPNGGADPDPKDELYVIHFPSSLPLRLTRKDCHAADPALSNVNFNHLCQTAQSSSGAPFFDFSFRLIGIHTGGGFGPTGGTNQGVRLVSILQRSSLLRTALAQHGRAMDGFTASISPRPVEATKLIKLATGDIIANDPNGWFRTVGSGDNSRRVDLKIQSSAAQSNEIQLWDPTQDVIYKISPDQKSVKLKQGNAPSWSSIGVR